MLRFGTFVPERVVHVKEVAVPFVEAFNDRAAPSARIDMFTGGSLGRGGNMQLRLLETGVLDITWFPLGYVPGRFPGAELFEFPSLSDDPVALTKAFWRLYERGYLPSFNAVRPLALSVSPPYNFHLTEPVITLADLSGRKVRVVNAAQSFVIGRLGATPVGGISATQVAESMSRGLIDGALFSWHATRPLGIEQIATAHIIQPIAFSTSIIVMNADSYGRLPAKARAVLDALSGEGLSLKLTHAMMGEAARAVARVEAGDHQFYLPSRAEKLAFRTAFEDWTESWIGRDPTRAALFETFSELLAEIAREGAGRGLGG